MLMSCIIGGKNDKGYRRKGVNMKMRSIGGRVYTV